MHDTFAVFFGLDIDLTGDGLIAGLRDVEPPAALGERGVETGGEWNHVVVAGGRNAGITRATAGGAIHHEDVDIAVTFRGCNGSSDGNGGYASSRGCGAACGAAQRCCPEHGKC